jgi:hypothetical protein
MTDPATHTTRQITRLVGVYDAEGTLRGELAYWVGARLGRRHCSLCEITHGLVRQRPEWTACRAGLPIRFDTFHLDDQPAEVRAAAAGTAPVVVAEVGADHIVLLGPDELEACHGSVDGLMSSLEAAAHAKGLSWTTS